MTPAHQITSLYRQEIDPCMGLPTVPGSPCIPAGARAAASAFTCRLYTDIGTLHLIRSRDSLATGFLAIHPRLSLHHATPAVTVQACGKVQLDGVYLHHALQPFLELEIQHVVSLHLEQLRGLPLPEGMLSVSEQALRMAVGTGEACIRKEGTYLTISWESGQHEHRWAMFDDASALNLRPACSCTKQNQVALGAFHQQLTAAYQQPNQLTPISIGLAALQLHQEEKERATIHHQRHWSKFAVQYMRPALSI
ncbi:hypothetical protein J2Y00_003589 [Deinococcus soli (ex Cha et al. 2016)]|uniref:Uncharacterized protein n=1 Tax=Deinococcus soli (ex Cha et al. 2016) TaxID=1309411 RepID=A0AAE4BMC3_9DEIO|nr:hypothetical protein [Deinococcus soli (ex Cha et al. 2016)]MDR6219978.1 hypothetical protein [Deinococcus soli (ex Cha et al. 2016)]